MPRAVTFTDQYTGRVYRDQETNELLWIVAHELRDSEIHEALELPWIVCEALCLTGPNTGHSRTLNPTYLDEQCVLIEANYEYAPGGTELVLASQTVSAITAVSKDPRHREEWPFTPDDREEEE